MGSLFNAATGVGAAGDIAQFFNSRNANNRQQNAELQAIQNQQAIRGQANDAVNKQISTIANDNPNGIASQATGDYVAQLRKNAAGAQSGTTGGTQTFGQSTSSLPAVVGANPRYAKDVAASQQQVQQYGDTAAGQMGQIDAAVRQRQNEALGDQTLGTTLNTLNAKSYGQSFVDQLRAQAAGQTNPWISLGAGLLGTVASGLSKNLGGSTETSKTPALQAGNPGYTPSGGGVPA